MNLIKIVSKNLDIATLNKKKFVFFLSLQVALITSCNPRLEKEKNYYPNGNVASEISNQNGKKHGICRGYSETGVLLEEVSYFEGLFDGRVRFFYETGALLYEAEYKKGTLWNIKHWRDKHGKGLNIGDFKNGEGQLFVYDFAGTGVLNYSGKMKSGCMDGKWYIYRRKGREIDSLNFNNGYSESYAAKNPFILNQ